MNNTKNKIDIEKVTLGSDPEFFIFNTKTNKFVPSCGWIGGKKDKPVYIADQLGHQEDNVTVEFNVPPTTSSKELYNNIQKLINYIEEKHSFNERGLTIVPLPSAEFEIEDLLANPESLEFGCDPDFNAWTNEKNTIEPGFTTLRSCGGHVCIGYPNHTKETNLEIIKALDLYLGVPSVLLDKDTRRKELYGKAGAFRHQKYGVEYRVLSNFYYADQSLLDWVFNNVYTALDKINNNALEIDSDLATLIQNCINNNDKERAMFIIEKFGILMPKDLVNSVEKTTTIK
jgi:hypothetical protein